MTEYHILAWWHALMRCAETGAAVIAGVALGYFVAHVVAKIGEIS